MKKLSFIVPCYNEEKEIKEFYGLLIQTLANVNYDYEIIFVDDGSTDNTPKLLSDLSKTSTKVKIITFSRNFGQQPALICGFKHSVGDCCIELDVKLDLPFDLIPKMIEKWEDGSEVVHAKRFKTNPFKKFITNVYLKFLRLIAKITIPLDTDEFKLYDKKVVDEICSMTEQNKNIVSLTSWVGFKQSSVVCSHKIKSKSRRNPIKKAMSFASAGIIGNSTWPLCLSFWAGLLLNIGCQVVFTIFTCMAINKHYVSLTAWLFPTIIMLFSLLFTVNSFSNMYLGKIYQEVKGRPDYIIANKTNFEK